MQYNFNSHVIIGVKEKITWIKQALIFGAVGIVLMLIIKLIFFKLTLADILCWLCLYLFIMLCYLTSTTRYIFAKGLCKSTIEFIEHDVKITYRDLVTKKNEIFTDVINISYKDIKAIKIMEEIKVILIDSVYSKKRLVADMQPQDLSVSEVTQTVITVDDRITFNRILEAFHKHTGLSICNI